MEKPVNMLLRSNGTGIRVSHRPANVP